MYNVVVVHGANALEHFFPVITREAEVELAIAISRIKLHSYYAGQVGFAKFHELRKS